MRVVSNGFNAALVRGDTHKTEGSRELVVHLVNVLVQRAVVEGSVGKVVVCVLEDEERGDLDSHRLH